MHLFYTICHCDHVSSFWFRVEAKHFVHNWSDFTCLPFRIVHPSQISWAISSNFYWNWLNYHNNQFPCVVQRQLPIAIGHQLVCNQFECIPFLFLAITLTMWQHVPPYVQTLNLREQIHTRSVQRLFSVGDPCVCERFFFFLFIYSFFRLTRFCVFTQNCF